MTSVKTTVKHKAKESTDLEALISGLHPESILPTEISALVVESDAIHVKKGEKVTFCFFQIEWDSKDGVDKAIYINGLCGAVWVDYSSMLFEKKTQG